MQAEVAPVAAFVGPIRSTYHAEPPRRQFFQDRLIRLKGEITELDQRLCQLRHQIMDHPPNATLEAWKKELVEKHATRVTQTKRQLADLKDIVCRVNSEELAAEGFETLAELDLKYFFLHKNYKYLNLALNSRDYKAFAAQVDTWVTTTATLQQSNLSVDDKLKAFEEIVRASVRYIKDQHVKHQRLPRKLNIAIKQLACDLMLFFEVSMNTIDRSQRTAPIKGLFNEIRDLSLPRQKKAKREAVDIAEISSRLKKLKIEEAALSHAKDEYEGKFRAEKLLPNFAFRHGNCHAFAKVIASLGENVAKGLQVLHQEVDAKLVAYCQGKAIARTGWTLEQEQGLFESLSDDLAEKLKQAKFSLSSAGITKDTFVVIGYLSDLETCSAELGKKLRCYSELLHHTHETHFPAVGKLLQLLRTVRVEQVASNQRPAVHQLFELAELARRLTVPVNVPALVQANVQFAQEAIKTAIDKYGPKVVMLTAEERRTPDLIFRLNASGSIVEGLDNVLKQSIRSYLTKMATNFLELSDEQRSEFDLIVFSLMNSQQFQAAFQEGRRFDVTLDRTMEAYLKANSFDEEKSWLAPYFLIFTLIGNLNRLSSSQKQTYKETLNRYWSCQTSQLLASVKAQDSPRLKELLRLAITRLDAIKPAPLAPPYLDRIQNVERPNWDARPNEHDITPYLYLQLARWLWPTSPEMKGQATQELSDALPRCGEHFAPQDPSLLLAMRQYALALSMQGAVLSENLDTICCRLMDEYAGNEETQEAYIQLYDLLSLELVLYALEMRPEVPGAQVVHNGDQKPVALVQQTVRRVRGAYLPQWKQLMAILDDFNKKIATVKQFRDNGAGMRIDPTVETQAACRALLTNLQELYSFAERTSGFKRYYVACATHMFDQFKTVFGVDISRETQQS